MIKQNQIDVIKSAVERIERRVEIMHDNMELHKRFIDGCFGYFMGFEYFKELVQSNEIYHKGSLKA